MASAAVRADSPESACCGYQFGYQRCRRRTIFRSRPTRARGPLTRWFMSRPGSVATDASGRSAIRPPDLRAMSTGCHYARMEAAADFIARAITEGPLDDVSCHVAWATM